ncbi:MAG: serine hydrolase domain-containing protein [Acidobacteriota bacterium]
MRPFFAATLLITAVCLPRAQAQIREEWPGNLTSEAARAWADHLFEEALERDQIDGAVVTVVRGDETLFETGYGFADRVEGRPASAETPFRSGSVSKLFTAISMLQLVERGLVSLDDDINTHLRRATVETPLGTTTIRHLLTHSAGFEEKFRGSLVTNPQSERATPEDVRRFAHRQVRTPGSVTSYSNHGMGTAGVIVEDVSGMTFGDYVAAHVFEPLGMKDASVEFPGKLASDIAREHDVLPDGSLQQRPLLYKAPYYLGSGGFFYSARDMASFLRAVLQRSPALLSSSSWHEALTLQKASGEGLLGGIGLGFWIYELAAEDSTRPTIAGHGGSTEGFESRLFLFPDERIGLFFAVVDSNPPPQGEPTFSTWTAAWDFVEGFRGLPARPTNHGTEGPDIADFAGTFLPNRRPYSGPEVLLMLVGQRPLKISAQSGDLTLSGEPMQRIGARTFLRTGEQSPPRTLEFSEDLQTVWTGGSTSFTRYPRLHPTLFAPHLIVALLVVALSSVVASLWPRREERPIDVLFALAALLAALAPAVPVLAIGVFDDHFRLESPRYWIQSATAWGMLLTTLAAILRWRGQRTKSSRLASAHRGAVLTALVSLVGLYFAYGVLRF